MPNLDKTKQSNEFDRIISMLESKIKALEDRCTILETGLTSSDYFVCNNDTTYNGTNSKVLTIVKGRITEIT